MYIFAGFPSDRRENGTSDLSAIGTRITLLIYAPEHTGSRRVPSKCKANVYAERGLPVAGSGIHG